MNIIKYVSFITCLLTLLYQESHGIEEWAKSGSSSNLPATGSIRTSGIVSKMNSVRIQGGSIRDIGTVPKVSGSIRSSPEFQHEKRSQECSSNRPHIMGDAVSLVDPVKPKAIGSIRLLNTPAHTIRGDGEKIQPTFVKTPSASSKSIRPGQGIKERSGNSGSIRPGGSLTAGDSLSSHPTGSIRPGSSSGSIRSQSQSIRQSSDPLTSLTDTLTTGVSSAVGANIFILAPNTYRSHFGFFMRLVEILMNTESVQQIHLLVPELTSLNRRASDPSTGGKLVVQYFNPYERRGGGERRMTSSGKEWNRRNFQTDINSNSGANLKLFFDMAEDKALITALARKKFTFGIAELWDYGALHILWMLGIKKFVATQNMPLESIHYHYLGYLEKIMRQGDIPELWTAKYDDHTINTSSAEFINNLVAKVEVLRTEHYNMLHRFKQIFFANYRMKTEVPRYSELFAKIRCIFVNTQPYLDFPMPPGYPQEIVHIGGIHLDQRQYEATAQTATSSSRPADDDIEGKAILASRSKRGLILISFGSIINMGKIPDPAFDNFIALLSAYSDYEFLWKFSDPKKAHLDKMKEHKHVHIKEWLNQMALLENPQTKVFVSHCGINSVIEAVHTGVPLLCVPFMADQYYNSEALAKRNVAVVVNKDNLSALARKMEEVLDESYKVRMLEMRELLAESRPTARFSAEMQKLMRGD